MTAATTIVFGPTGQVGSTVALLAEERGAKVVLAMRDPEKPIPGLSAEKEKAGAFERVQADLTKPETIKDAVSKTGSTRAFIYLAFGGTDGMRSVAEALKAGGVEFVVFLSSAAVRGDLKEIKPDEYIPFAHAQVEISLGEVFGPDGYVAVRPAFFNSNANWWKAGFHKGEIKIYAPDAKFDWLSPEDIGAAAGNILVQGIQATEGAKDRNSVPLCGPELISLRDGAGILCKAFGKDVKFTEIDAEEAVGVYVENGMPPIVAKQLVKSFGKDKQEMYEPEAFQEASANLKKYAGRATSLKEWAEANKGFYDLK